MKKANYYFTLFLVLFTTLFSFIHMFQIVKISNQVIQILLTNLLPSLLPFMILISLCLSLGLFWILSYFIQFIFSPLFHLTPIMSSIYFISFFCGYPTNAKIIKEAYLYKQITIRQLQHLLSIASFSSLSFIFISLKLPFNISLIIYISHIIPSIISALFYKEKYTFMTFKEVLLEIQNPKMTFVNALKKSIISSFHAFIFIGGYMLVFQFLGYSLHSFISNPLIIAIIQGLLEFSSGSFQLLNTNHHLMYPLISFFLSFSGLSVLMQVDNILEDIPYSFHLFVISRFIHGILSFFICLLVILLML